MAQEVWDIHHAAQEYTQHAALSADPDYSGQQLYQAVLDACAEAREADRQHDLARWSQRIGDAQQGIAFLYDGLPNKTPTDRLMKEEHLLIWTALNQALLHHDEPALALAEREVTECLRQLTRRLAARAAATPVDAAW